MKNKENIKNEKAIKRILVYLIILLGLSGCGDTGMEVRRHFVSRDTLTTICIEAGTSKRCKGYAYWYWSDELNTCDIYMMSIENYDSETEYNTWWGHETRHCFEGHFHDNVRDAN